MKRILPIVLIAIFLMTILAGCTPSTKAVSTTESMQEKTEASATSAAAPADEEILVGYAVMRMVDEFWANQIKGIEDALKETGKNIKFEVADNNNDAQTTLQNVDSLLSKGVDILIVSTPDAKIGASIMEKANAKNVPVIACDVPIEGAYYVTYDNYGAGVLAGEYAAEYFLENMPGQKAEVALLTHAAVSIVKERVDGFQAAFSKAIPDANFLPVQDAEGLREKGANVMADMITANPNINVAFGINDDIALGAASSVEARGLSDKIAVFGMGGIGETSFRALLDPKSPFKGTVAFSPYNHGVIVVTALITPMLEGKTVEMTVMSPIEMATPENAQSYLDN